MWPDILWVIFMETVLIYCHFSTMKKVSVSWQFSEAYDVMRYPYSNGLEEGCGKLMLGICMKHVVFVWNILMLGVWMKHIVHLVHSPWHNHTGWLGIKHQVTYLPGLMAALRNGWWCDPCEFCDRGLNPSSNTEPVVHILRVVGSVSGLWLVSDRKRRRANQTNKITLV